jgi:NADPH:quinone reductase-like Zn-dependent oxidoreductase
MKAIIHRAFGAPEEVLALGEVETPIPAPNEVLVKVESAAIAKGAWLTTVGLPYIARPIYGIGTPKVRVAGLELSGVVRAVGAAVTRFSPGDEVFGTSAGALAEFAAVPEDSLASKPAQVTFEQAAAAPVSGLAALQAVRDAAQVKRGEHLLVIGASGSVGAFAVQIAKSFGARVTGVASAANVQRVLALGAERVIDYRREEVGADGTRYDVILDLAGNRPVSALRQALTPTGTLVIVGGTGGNVTMGFGRTVGTIILSPFVKQRLVGFISEPNRADLEILAELMRAGTISPVVRTTFPLAQSAAAVELAGAGAGHGTVVVSI